MMEAGGNPLLSDAKTLIKKVGRKKHKNQDFFVSYSLWREYNIPFLACQAFN